MLDPKTTEAFSKYFQENDLPFVGLPDPKHSVLKRYGQEIKLFKFGRMPAMVIIDKQGYRAVCALRTFNVRYP